MLYVRYLQVFRQLDKVYDQVVHPQKRRVIQAILEGVMGRVLELKNEMVEKEFSEYHYMDDVLHDLKLTPVSFKTELDSWDLYKATLTCLCKRLALSGIMTRIFLSFKIDLEIPIPCYFINECSKELQEQKMMLTDILKMVEVTESPEVSWKVATSSFTPSTVPIIIIINFFYNIEYW